MAPFGGATALLAGGGYATIRGPATVAAIQEAAEAGSLTDFFAEAGIGLSFGGEVLTASAVGGGIGILLGGAAYGAYRFYQLVTSDNSSKELLSAASSQQQLNINLQISPPLCVSGS